MPSEHDFNGAIRALLAEKLLIQVDSAETDLLEAGILDSLALVQLLLHLEERFGVKIPLEDLEIDDLRTLPSIARLVENQLRAQTEVAVNR
jgi:D-alanine--poly(phosphoribitol) ligase subunit 2